MIFRPQHSLIPVFLYIQFVTIFMKNIYLLNLLQTLNRLNELIVKFCDILHTTSVLKKLMERVLNKYLQAVCFYCTLYNSLPVLIGTNIISVLMSMVKESHGPKFLQDAIFLQQGILLLDVSLEEKRNYKKKIKPVLNM